MVVVRRWHLVPIVLVLIFCVALSSGPSEFEYPPSAGNLIDFGDVNVHQTASAQYTFRVLATSQTSAQVTIYDPCSPFGLSGLASQSMVLQPGQSVTFAVTFTPTQARTYTCSFVIRASGGYPVQVTETVVQLSGRGVGESGSQTSETTIPGFPFGLPPIETTPTGDAQSIVGVTETDGAFQAAIPPATTAGGTLRECDGQPLGNQEYILTPIADGYEIAVEGYEPISVRPISRFSLFGMESVDLGEICVEPATQIEGAGPTACPCCSITVEARMCCNPKDQYVETDTVYEPQLVRIRVAYCEPPEELGDVDLTPLPLTNTGGVLVNPGLIPPAASTGASQIGVTSIALDDRVLFEGHGSFEQVVPASSLTPGTHTVRAVVGRLNGEECICEKTFEVLACPAVNAEIERTLEPKSGCAPVAVTYDLDWPDGADDICRILFWNERGDILEGNLIDGFPLTETYSALDACRPRPVEPAAYFDASNCCRYELSGEPFTVVPPFRVSDECVCLRVAQDAVQVVLQSNVPTGKRLPCILCEDYDVVIHWGDGLLSDVSTFEYNETTGEWTATHPYVPDPEEDPRHRINISVAISSPCGAYSDIFTSDCLFPTDLIPEYVVDMFLAIAEDIRSPLEAALVVDSLLSAFDQVGKTQGKTTVCSVLLDMRLKGIDVGVYADFDKLVKSFRSGIAGGVFERDSTGSESGPEKWRYYPTGPGGDSSAKLVYVSGDSPYFELTLLRGSCDDCPVLPTYRIVSTLTDIRQAERHIEEAREGLEGSSEVPETSSQVFSVTLEIGLCCPPNLCNE